MEMLVQCISFKKTMEMVEGRVSLQCEGILLPSIPVDCKGEVN